MENQQWEIEELNFQPRKQSQIEKQRKLLSYYAKLDCDKQRKSKQQLFTRETIEGLLTIFDVNPNKVQFIREDELITQISSFMMNTKKIVCKMGEKIEVNQNQFYILFEGTLIKKQDNIPSISQSFITQLKKKRNSTTRVSQKNQNAENRVSKTKQNIVHVVSNSIKKIAYKRVQSNEKLSPRVIYYECLDKKPYQAKTDCLLFQFPFYCLQKIQYWIDSKEKQGLISFMSQCLGVDDQKSLSKLLHKLNKQKIVSPYLIPIQPKIIYMIYYGQILLTTSNYKISLNKNSIIYKNQISQFLQAKSTNQGTLLISIQIQEVNELLKQSFETSLEQIMAKLSSLHMDRLQFLERVERPVREQQPSQPLFDTKILNIKSFEKHCKYQYQCESQQRSLQSNKYFFLRPKTSNLNSTRFRNGTQSNLANTLQPQLTVFLSNYPYQKLVQSQTKIHQILKGSLSLGKNKRKFTYQASTIQQKRKVEKEKKKLYYINKVRKLKIKNIAQKQIPNGHKKKFDVEGAEKQIQHYSLFTNIIEYPMSGISENAKDSLTKNIRKLVNIISMNSKNQKTDKNTSQQAISLLNENQKNKNASHDQYINSINLNSSQKIRSSIKSANRQISEKKYKNDEDKNSDMQSQFQLKTTSFYFGNNLNPHLPPQKQMRYKSIKTSYDNGDKQNINFNKTKFSSQKKKEKVVCNKSTSKITRVNFILHESANFKTNYLKSKTEV